VSTLAPLLAVLLAGVALSWSARRTHAGSAAASSPLIRLSPTKGIGDRAQSWIALRVLAVAGLLGLSLVVTLPWMVATGALECVIPRAGEACVDGAPISPWPWIAVMLTTIPMVLLVSGDLRRMGPSA